MGWILLYYIVEIIQSFNKKSELLFMEKLTKSL